MFAIDDVKVAFTRIAGSARLYTGSVEGVREEVSVVAGQPSIEWRTNEPAFATFSTV
jgi:hypothetical protein